MTATKRTPPTCYARSAMYRAKAAIDAGDGLTAGREFIDCITQFLAALVDHYGVTPADGTLLASLQALADCPDCCTSAEQHMRDAIAIAEKLALGAAVDADEATVAMFYVNDMLVMSHRMERIAFPADGKPANWTWDHDYAEGDR